MTLEVERHWRHFSDPVRITVGMSVETAVLDDPDLKGIILQNVGTTVLKFAFGGFVPTQTLYSFALKGGSANDDANGSIYLDAHATVILKVISSGAGGLLVVTEIR